MHLIHHHNIDFNCTSKTLGFEVQEQCGDVIRTELYPAIDKLLSRFDLPDIVWAIDRIEININCNSRNWKQAIVQETLLQLEEFLKNAYKSKKTDKENLSDYIDEDKITTSEYSFRLFLSFLKSGVLPVNSISAKIKDIIEKTVWSKAEKNKLYAVLSENPAALLRFILSVSDEVKNSISEQIAEKIFNFEIKNQVVTKTINQKESQEIQQLLQETLIWTELLNHQITFDYYERLITELSKLFDPVSVEINLNLLLEYATLGSIGLDKNILNKLSRFVEDERTTDKIKSTENQITAGEKDISASDIEQFSENVVPELKAVFIENAGLIILHPFLELLFSNLKLCEGKKWMNAMSQHKAVLVMQYLCTGSNEFWSSDLFFNKLYCGFSPDSVINTSIALTDEDKIHCDEMLTSVIGHWEKLGKTSVEGLRETFLLRNGKITLSDNELTLNVENSGVDILLEYLPWSIRTVKSPWLDKIINCIWEY